MKKYPFIILSILTLFIYSCGGSDSVTEIDKILKATSDKMNKTMAPMFIDEETRWDSTIPLPNGKLMYLFTLPNYSKNELSDVEIEEVKQSMFLTIKNGWKTDPKHNWFRENKIVLKYKYRDKNGNHLFEFTFIAGQ